MANIRAESSKKKSVGRHVKKVWMFSYESAGLAQAGGLGEAVGGLAQTLASDYNTKVTVFLPSHSRHKDPTLRDRYGLKEETRFIAQGYRTGVNGVQYPFLAGVERGQLDGVELVLAKGLDAPTSRWLDDPILYGHDITFEKMALFARTVRLYSEFLTSMRMEDQLPDLIHANDWHMVPAGVSIRQNLEEKGRRIPLVFTVHLLSFVTLPWHYASEDWCGIRDLKQKVALTKGRSRRMTYSQVWETQCQGSLEKFGCYEADYVTSVSESYLNHDVLNYVGSVIDGKSGHIYNGCDWDPDQIRSTYLKEKPGKPTTVEDVAELSNRWDIRAFFLTKGIARISEMVVEGTYSGVSKQAEGRKVKPFRSDGPMVLMTGRLSSQKGVDLLVDAVPAVQSVVPNVRFVLFLLPSSEEENRIVQQRASAFPDNVRIIFVQDRPAYLIAHMAADVYAMPSRSEPFGISALEAMITGNPVVGSNLGGISETVLDITKHGEEGTGLLIPPGDTGALADSIIGLLCTMRIDEAAQQSRTNEDSLVNDIPVNALVDLVSQDSKLGTKIRQNCIARVEKNFRWKNAGQIALNRYSAALKHSLRYS